MTFLILSHPWHPWVSLISQKNSVIRNSHRDHVSKEQSAAPHRRGLSEQQITKMTEVYDTRIFPLTDSVP